MKFFWNGKLEIFLISVYRPIQQKKKHNTRMVMGAIESVGKLLIALLNASNDDFLTIYLGSSFQRSLTPEAHEFFASGVLLGRFIKRELVSNRCD